MTKTDRNMKLETYYKNFVERSLNWGFRAIAMSGVGWLLACGADDCCDFLLCRDNLTNQWQTNVTFLWQPDKPMSPSQTPCLSIWCADVNHRFLGAFEQNDQGFTTKRIAWKRFSHRKCAKFPCYWSSKPVHWTSLLWSWSWSWSLLLVVFFSRSWS